MYNNNSVHIVIFVTCVLFQTAQYIVKYALMPLYNLVVAVKNFYSFSLERIFIMTAKTQNIVNK